MTKIPVILGLSLLLIATPVLAKDNNQNSSNNGHQFAVNVTADDGDSDKNDPQASTSPNPSTSPSASCNPDGDFKNHGEFVNCVAHLHLGGDKVSEAAHSDIGKHEEEEEQEGASPSATPSFSPSPTASPVASPTSSPESSSSASPSPTATASGSASLSSADQARVQNLINILQGIIDKLKNLL